MGNTAFVTGQRVRVVQYDTGYLNPASKRRRR